MKPGNDMKDSARQVSANFKAAGQLVQKQAQRTKIATVDLPRAHVSLGKYVYGLDDSKTKYASECRAIDGLREKLDALATASKARPSGEGIAAKAQGVLKGAGDLAQRKLIENQLASALARLGEAASAHPLTGGESFLKAVDDLKARLAELDGEITALSQMSPAGGWLSPKRIVLGAAVLAAVLIAALALKPSGSRVKEDPYADDKRELAVLGEEQLARLRQADALWEKKDFDGAAALYAQVVEIETKTFGGTQAQDSLPQPTGRLVDHIAGKGGMAAATEYALKTLHINRTPLVMTDAGSKALEAARREQTENDQRRERENAARRREEDSQGAMATRSVGSPAAEETGELPTGLTGILGERVGPDLTTDELRAVAGRFIQNEVRPGWELERVLGLLGKPSTFARTNGLVGQSPEQQKKFMDDPLIPPGVKRTMLKELVICTWNDSSDPDNRYISLAFVDGRLSGDNGAIVVRVAN